jgi:hypothetical protein
MAEGRFPEVVEAKKPPGDGENLLRFLEVFLGNSPVADLQIPEGVGDPKRVREKPDPFFL